MLGELIYIYSTGEDVDISVGVDVGVVECGLY